MTAILKKIGWLLVCICMMQTAFGQAEANVAKLKTMVQYLKDTKTYGYDYRIEMNYPNGQTDQLDGLSYVDGPEKIMFNRSTLFTMLLTPRWFYRADHHEKTVTIVDLTKHYNDTNKVGYRSEIFSNSFTAYFLDSMVMKYGILDKYEEKGDVINLAFHFKAGAPMQKMEVSFDMGTRLILLLKSYMFYPDEHFSRNGTIKGTRQVVICKNYRRDITMADKDTEKYFTVKDGTVQLRLYKNYKIYSLL